MSCIEYETVEIEESNIEKEGKFPNAKPLAAPGRRVHRGDQVARRVAEVLKAQLAHGSMPA